MFIANRSIAHSLSRLTLTKKHKCVFGSVLVKGFTNTTPFRANTSVASDSFTERQFVICTRDMALTTKGLLWDLPILTELST